jgi:hypothetical protein
VEEAPGKPATIARAAKGGRARATSLSKAKRVEIAKRASAARWKRR